MGRDFSNHVRMCQRSSSSSCSCDAGGVISSTITPGRTFPTGSCSSGVSSRDVPGEHWIKKTTHPLDFFGGDIQALGATAQRAADAAAG